MPLSNSLLNHVRIGDHSPRHHRWRVCLARVANKRRRESPCRFRIANREVRRYARCCHSVPRFPFQGIVTLSRKRHYYIIFLPLSDSSQFSNVGAVPNWRGKIKDPQIGRLSYAGHRVFRPKSYCRPPLMPRPGMVLSIYCRDVPFIRSQVEIMRRLDCEGRTASDRR